MTKVKNSVKINPFIETSQTWWMTAYWHEVFELPVTCHIWRETAHKTLNFTTSFCAIMLFKFFWKYFSKLIQKWSWPTILSMESRKNVSCHWFDLEKVTKMGLISDIEILIWTFPPSNLYAYRGNRPRGVRIWPPFWDPSALYWENHRNWFWEIGGAFLNRGRFWIYLT